MNAPKNKWEGLRAICVARQSNDKDGTGSNKAQTNYMQIKVTGAGMRVVDTLALDGVSASAPARIREFVMRLFDRKKEKNDFDVIAWQVEDRASRSGGEHGMWLQHEAKYHDLLVFFPDDADRAPSDGERFYKYEAAKDTGISTGRRSAQGQSYAQQQGFFRTAEQTPLGCDRLYYGQDDKPKFIIHNAPTGLQEQREYGTDRVIGTYGTVGPKSRNRFRKQKNEYSLLCPGDRDQQQVVRVIFYMRYKKGMRGCRIADFLNRNAVPSTKGQAVVTATGPDHLRKRGVHRLHL